MAYCMNIGSDKCLELIISNKRLVRLVIESSGISIDTTGLLLTSSLSEQVFEFELLDLANRVRLFKTIRGHKFGSLGM